MKAIDRAALWTGWLEQVGFDVECETSDEFGGEYLTVKATSGRKFIRFVIRMDSKFTQFVTGSVTVRGLLRRTLKPGQMSGWVSREVELEQFRMEQEVSA